MELFRALGALAEAPSTELSGIAQSLELGALPSVHEHTELFGMQLVPYASIYLDGEGRIGGEARDRITGFWRVLDLKAPAEADHLTIMLCSYAELAAMESAAGSEVERVAKRHRRHVFLCEHLASWLPVYLLRFADLAPPFYRRWAGVLSRALVAEVDRWPEPPVEAMHFRLSPEFPAAGCELEELLEALLSPIRAGFVLTRRDLAGAARRLNIGCRIGERRFMLEAMLRQRPADLRSWLEGFCDRSLHAYCAREQPLYELLRPWRARVELTRRTLRRAS